MNKKGLTEVITIMMIILISISAATIFSVAILKTTAQLSPAISCGEYRISQTVKLKNYYFSKEQNEIKLTVERKLNTKLKNIKFSVNTDKNKEEWICGESCGDCSIPLEGETKSYQLQLNQLSTPLTLTISPDGCILQRVKLEPC